MGGIRSAMVTYSPFAQEPPWPFQTSQERPGVRGRALDMKRLLATTLALGAAPATAQQYYDLGTVVLSANQTETEADRVGATVDVLDEEDLQRNAGVQLIDTLTRLPGLTSSSNGGVGKTTTLRIRGLGSGYIGTRINGIDVTDPSTGQPSYNWGGLTGAGLSRVEILKGSQSALYGSSAIAGVVNISTWRPSENGMSYRFSGEAGSYGTAGVSASVGYLSDRAEMALTMSRLHTDGFSAADENAGNTESDGFDGKTIYLSGSYALSERLRVGFDAIYAEQESDIDGYESVPPYGLIDTADQNFTDRKGGRVFAIYSGDVVTQEIEGSHFKTTRLDPNGATKRFEGIRQGARYTGTADLSFGPLVFGAEYNEEKSILDGVRARNDTASIFGEAQFALSDNLDVTTSLRIDRHSDFGTEPTGRLALAWRPDQNWVVRAALATGFRAPSLYELYGPYGLATLQPEKSRSLELGVERKLLGAGSINATLFYTEIDDLIRWSGSSYAQVSGTTETRGIELSADLPVNDRVSLFGNYTYTDAKEEDGSQPARVPKHDLLLGVSAELAPRLNGQIMLNHVADRVDQGPMPDYTLVNAGLTYDLTPASQVYLRIENLADEQYQTAKGYGTSDRAFYVGVRADF